MTSTKTAITNIRKAISNAKLLQKASAVKFGWLAMATNGKWKWFSKKPHWCIGDFWWCKGFCDTATVKFLKLPKRAPSFAPRSLIKCTSRGPILLSANKMYHRTWGMISVTTSNNLKKGAR